MVLGNLDGNDRYDVRKFRRMPLTVSSIYFKPPMPPWRPEVLLGIIERATERLTVKAEVHRERARRWPSWPPTFWLLMTARTASASVALSWHTDGAWLGDALRQTPPQRQFIGFEWHERRHCSIRHSGRSGRDNG